jgi:hypothetical protein
VAEPQPNCQAARRPWGFLGDLGGLGERLFFEAKRAPGGQGRESVGSKRHIGDLLRYGVIGHADSLLLSRQDAKKNLERLCLATSSFQKPRDKIVAAREEI